MLKKIIIGFLCFIVVGIIALGIYIYMLDWNKHKSFVSERFSQITGLKTLIDGNLRVELLPTPRFTANKVKFSKNNNFQDPLVVVNEISANVALLPLFHNKFILSSMTLNGATVNVTKSEDGKFNWSGVVTNNKNKSGNLEVSFNDIRLANSTFSYKDLKTNKEFVLPNISASISAPSLKGPYKTNGNFIYNNSEFKFNGNIIKDKDISVKMDFENVATASKSSIDGTLGGNAKGNMNFDIPHLQDLVTVLFGENTLKEFYNKPLFISFSYSKEPSLTKLDNFNISYGNNNKGNGSVAIKNDQDKTSIIADLKMSLFDLDILEQFAADTANFSKSKKINELLSAYSGAFSLKSGKVVYRGAQAQNLNLELNLDNNILKVSPFTIELPANTFVKTTGVVDFNNAIHYQFNQSFKTDDLRVFASIFGIDLSKYASDDNKKNIFKKSEAELNFNGDLNNLTIASPKAIIDASELTGNVGFIKKDQKQFVLASIQVSKVLFDKYVQVLPESMGSASLEDKILHQLNLISWNHDTNVEMNLLIGSAVYNDVPLKGINLKFVAEQDTLKIEKLAIDDLAGAKLNLTLDASNVYKAPFFNELAYDVKTSNFPLLAAALGLHLKDKELFRRKVFASQGALNGSCNDFNVSSIQKFGDTEFSYTGVVSNAKIKSLLDGDLELKSNDFSSLIRDLGFDYKPNIPMTSFTLSGKLKGSFDNFSIKDLTSYLGGDKIAGDLQADYSVKTPKIAAKLDFDQFDADHLLDLSQFVLLKSSTDKREPFVSKPDFDDKKFDYSFLKSVDFDIQTEIKRLTCKNSTYSDVQFGSILENGVLKVDHLKAKKDQSDIDLTFELDSNNIPSINGSYNTKSLALSQIGGSVYVLDPGLLDAKGDFSSSAVSSKDFFENLTSKGDFKLSKTTMKGWDLDIIKFELEQRKSVEGFQDSVLNSLKSGKSVFSKISGKYDISKGVIIADNIALDSPVVHMDMKLNLNLSDWLFKAVCDTVYHNASFADVLKFTFNGNLANPVVTTDLSESIQRIGRIEKQLQDQQKKEEKSLQNKLSSKIDALKDRINSSLQETSRIMLDVVHFKPVSNHADVQKVYEDNLSLLNSYDDRLKKMLDVLRNNPKEEDLRDIESEFSAQTSKIEFIPRSLEDNFVVDSKYIFDDTFNKIAWTYSIAQNNSAYYDSLVSGYMKKVKSLNSSEHPIDEASQQKLLLGTQDVSEEMGKIVSLHNKIRDNYLDIMDTVQATGMENNNKIAKQALETILLYTENMNNKIIKSIEDYRAVLNIDTRDYDKYVIYPPKNAEDIDVSKSPVPNGDNTFIEEENDPEIGDVSFDEEFQDDIDKKKDDAILDKNNEAPILDEVILDNVEIPENKEEKLSGGLSSLINNPSFVNHEEIATKDEPLSTPSVLENSLKQEIVENNEAIIVNDSEKKNLISQPILDADHEKASLKSDKLLTKTKTAINDILEKIKFNKYTTKEELAEQSEDMNLKLKDEEVDEASLGDSSFHKINPVVAMDIGKPSLEVNIPIGDDYSGKKSGFKKVLYTADQSLNPDSSNKPSENKPKFTINPRDFLLEMIKAEHAVGQAIVSQNIKALQHNEEVKEGGVIAEESENKDSGETVELAYVKTDKTDNALVTAIGKSMLSGFVHPVLEPDIERKYLFTLNGQNFIPFYGYVSKNTSLYTK